MRRARVAGAALAGVLLVPLVAAAALAHPLGNFTINHYAGIRVEPDRILLDVVIDQAEIPTFQATMDLDQDGDGEFSDEELQGAELEWCTSVGRADADGRRRGAPLRLIEAGISFPPGNGGLSTMRLVCTLESPFAAPLGAPVAVEFADGFEAARIGWREITVVGSGVTIAGTDLPAESATGRLTSYPSSLASAPDVRTAAFTATPGGPCSPRSTSPTRTRSSPSSSPGRPRRRARRRHLSPSLATLAVCFGSASTAPAAGVATSGSSGTGAVPGGEGAIPDILRSLPVTPALALLAFATAVLLGAGHALTPGHGKTLMAAYLVGTRGTPRHALGLGRRGVACRTRSGSWGSPRSSSRPSPPCRPTSSSGPPRSSPRSRSSASAAGCCSPRSAAGGRRDERPPRDPASTTTGTTTGMLTRTRTGRRTRTGMRTRTRTGRRRTPRTRSPIPTTASSTRHGGVSHRHVPPAGSTITWRSLFVLGLAGGLIPSTNALLILLTTIAAGQPGVGRRPGRRLRARHGRGDGGRRPRVRLRPRRPRAWRRARRRRPRRAARPAGRRGPRPCVGVVAGEPGRSAAARSSDVTRNRADALATPDPPTRDTLGRDAGSDKPCPRHGNCAGRLLRGRASGPAGRGVDHHQVRPARRRGRRRERGLRRPRPRRRGVGVRGEPPPVDRRGRPGRRRGRPDRQGERDRAPDARSGSTTGRPAQGRYETPVDGGPVRRPARPQDRGPDGRRRGAPTRSTASPGPRRSSGPSARRRPSPRATARTPSR